MVTRLAAAILVVLSTIACGTSSQPSGATTPARTATHIGPLVLLERGCTYGGPAQVGSGPVALEMTNETKSQFNVDLWKLNDGHPYAELDAHIKEEQRRIAAGEPELGHPTFATLIDQESVVAGTETKNVFALTPGVYGFVCIAFETGGPGAIWLAGPLSVGA